ncbi:hypothetical protein C5167_033945 [Papaver somniferum]|uniref:Uncharacterized protein n=1 Tax=Papaver somniferum TaxID=3469 RepID=A0A4Y7KEN5_PAPSO|nr:hypothetical protein C5167_033945 [Papaver somniferum]
MVSVHVGWWIFQDPIHQFLILGYIEYVEIFSNFRILCILNSSEGLVVKQQICKEQYPILFRLKEAVFRDMRVDIGWLLCFS